MAPPLLSLTDVHLSFGGTPLLEGASLSIERGARLCLVGRNGSGKSTLLKIAAGLVEADGGQRLIGNGVTVRYLPQEPDLSAYPTIEAYVLDGLGASCDPYAAGLLIAELGLDPAMSTRNLSGGEIRRAALARTLAPEPDILMLDEPTNHLDLPVIEWLEAYLKSCRSALVLISHDRRFLETLSRQCLWLDRGVTRTMDNGFAAFEDWRDQILAEEEIAHHKLKRKIVAEEHWMRYGVTARRKRNMKRVGDLQTLRQTYRSAQKPMASLRITTADDPPESGRKVIEAKNICKSYDGRAIVKDTSIRIMRGERIGIIGANGSGKTTLIKLLTGEIEPDSGVIKMGVNLEVATLDQHRRLLDADITVSELLTEGRGDTVEVQGEPRHVIGYMQDFLFTPAQARTPVRVLSGGERGRLMLARALAVQSNVLVLDEPTNDLDLETLDVLQDMLASYEGTVLLVSHDRDFIDRVSTSVLMAEGDGRFTAYAGGYSDMVAQRGGGVSARKAEVREQERREKTARAEVPPPRQNVK